MLDKIPAPARHAVIAFVSIALGVIAAAIQAEGGVTGLDWGAVLIDALNQGVTGTVAAMLALIGLPVTRQYGVGAVTSSPDGDR